MRTPPLTITDAMFGGFFIQPDLVLSFSPIDFVTISFSVSYSFIQGTRGDSVYQDKGGNFDPALTFKNAAGGGYSALDIGLIAKFNIN
jgi:hypothetical protein